MGVNLYVVSPDLLEPHIYDSVLKIHTFHTLEPSWQRITLY